MNKEINEIKTGFLMMDDNYQVIYSNIHFESEINCLLQNLNIVNRIIKKDFGINICKDIKVWIKEINIKSQTLYIVEFKKFYNEEFYQLALTDVMTDLYNRNMWEHMLNDKFQKISNYEALLIIDIDNLKIINDTYGHAVGDLQIKIVSRSIKESIRKKDIAFRYGGDEFIILLSNIKESGVSKLIKQIRNRINKNSIDIDLGISVGFSIIEDDLDLQKAFSVADSLLYKEKHNKTNRNYITLHETKKRMEETRTKLNSLVVSINDNLNEEILSLSRSLDDLICRYMALEGKLESKFVSGYEPFLENLYAQKNYEYI